MSIEEPPIWCFLCPCWSVDCSSVETCQLVALLLANVCLDISFFVFRFASFLQINPLLLLLSRERGGKKMDNWWVRIWLAKMFDNIQSAGRHLLLGPFWCLFLQRQCLFFPFERSSAINSNTSLTMTSLTKSCQGSSVEFLLEDSKEEDKEDKEAKSGGRHRCK